MVSAFSNNCEFVHVCVAQHGGGHVFKTLQGLEWSTDEERTLVGAIVVEDKATISRHLKHCAKERNIPIMVISNSLFQI